MPQEGCCSNIGIREVVGDAAVKENQPVHFRAEGLVVSRNRRAEARCHCSAQSIAANFYSPEHILRLVCPIGLRLLPQPPNGRLVARAG